jgi:FtsP/CotA-like multicopper oxidase with cupredoxin domain
MHRRALPLLLAAAALLGAVAARPVPLVPDDAVTNDHRVIAGVRRDSIYTLALELRRTSWHPNAPSALTVDVPAFAEAGRAPSIPGPLIRVPAGTRMQITLHNRLSERAVVHGLHDHDGARDSVVLGAGESRAVRFVARRTGTFAYFARTTATPTLFSRRDDSQLMAAFIVDAAGTDPQVANARERVMVITAWDDSLRNPASPYGPRQVYAINGRSWPFTERLVYDEGDSLHWRVLNLSQHAHPMHLHGTYFRVQSRGTPFADTALGPAARMVVTEHLPAGATMTMAWEAARPGNWLFHCHTINHIDEALRLGEAAAQSAHADHGTVTDVMAGLVMAISVRPAARAATRPTAPRRRLRLVVTERAALNGAKPSLAYVLQRDGREPARDSLELPGSTLELRQGEPTAITVVNRSRQSTAVHWHGMELESLYDGVAGWSGSGTRVAPIIAPGDSFVAHMTPPRAGTFIYHTHAGELAQLTGGLYGALLVRPRHGGNVADDRVIVLADSTIDALSGRTPPSMINGRREPAPIDLTVGRAHRLRFISIGAVTRKQVRLLDGETVMRWTPVAKDGADFAPALRAEMAADQSLSAGETIDVLVTPERAGTWVLEVTSQYGPPITTRVPVRVRPRPAR